MKVGFLNLHDCIEIKVFVRVQLYILPRDYKDKDIWYELSKST